ncbi:uncharacterized protein LOC108582092, partial [Papio anubis]|uniref:uncharacterized protein LOC108582092 n=1 Tax=Papio anubis TaxID=9555 RepID=UPI000B7B23C3
LPSSWDYRHPPPSPVSIQQLPDLPYCQRPATTEWFRPVYGGCTVRVFVSSASPFDQKAEYSISGSWLRTQRREECGLHFTSLPSLALDLKFHTTEPNTSRPRREDHLRNRKLCLATDKLFQGPWDLQDVWNEERQLSQDSELSGGPHRNMLCGRRVFPIRQTVLQPRPPKRSNPGLLFSRTECGRILPFLCFLLQYLLKVHTWGLGKLGI